MTGELTLEEAIARAIKYNAERRVKGLEEALATRNFEAGKFDLLPKLVASAGYRQRDSDLITRSKDSVTGQPSLANPSISSSRSSINTELGFSWSLLDFGQSYYASQQNGDRVMIAAERRRKALHLLVQDVRTAFWRVVAAQALEGRLRVALSEAEDALNNAAHMEAEALRSPAEPLRFQRQLLENLRLLETVEQELSSARIELATLIALPIGTTLTVSEPTKALDRQWLKIPVEQMEEKALEHNPDLRENVYNARLARLESRRNLLKLFPNLSFNYGVKQSDDRYLINQQWQEAGIQVSFNLFNLLALRTHRRQAEANEALADQKRIASQVAVLAQVHIARLNYGNALRQFERADAVAKVDGRLADLVAKQAAAEKQSKLEHVAQQTASILSQLRRYQALANAEGAAARLQATLGLEPAIGDSDRLSLEQIKRMIGESVDTWDSASRFTASVTETAGAPAPDLSVAPQAETRAAAGDLATADAAAPAGNAPRVAEPVVSDAEARVGGRFAAWAESLKNKDFAVAFAHYSSRFRSVDGRRLDAWRPQRESYLEGFEAGSIAIENVRWRTLGKQVEAEYTQRIDAAGSPIIVTRRQIWSQENGEWRIVRELRSGPRAA